MGTPYSSAPLPRSACSSLYDFSRPWMCREPQRYGEVVKNMYMAIYFLLMIAIIVGADFLFLRGHFVARLIVNIAVVAVFAAVYFVFLKKL